LEESKMPKITLSIPDDVLKKFKKTFPEVNVAEVARRAISDKIEELKKLEKLKSEGKL
jgi:metal-responsive CopG/Arc/MetJ family transcriptional regulator